MSSRYNVRAWAVSMWHQWVWWISFFMGWK